MWSRVGGGAGPRWGYLPPVPAWEERVACPPMWGLGSKVRVPVTHPYSKLRWSKSGKPMVVWHSKDIGRNKFLIDFHSMAVKNMVLLGLPGSFYRYLVSLQECKCGVALKDIDFSPVPFWFELHDLPFVGMNKNMGKKLGEVQGMSCSWMWMTKTVYKV